MSNVSRRIFTALILIFLLTSMLAVNVYAARDTSTLGGTQESKMNAMGEETFEWYMAFRACIIPLLICQYASDGLKLLGNTLMTKGEYSLDGIKKHIFYCTVAAAVIVLLPVIMDWAMDLFKSRAWDPPAPNTPTSPISTGG